MRITGRLLKMKSKLGEVVEYHLPFEGTFLPVNEWMGKQVRIIYEHEIYCINCGKKTYKSFSQGFCYECFISAPEASECIIRPELCRAHEGIGRDLAWEKEHHWQEHFVYFAYSTQVKVGVTRTTQVPTRWIDQGATAVICLAKVPYRQLAGQIEVELKKYFTDKTNWQRMLKDPPAGEAEAERFLLDARLRAMDLLPENLRPYILEECEISHIRYPVSGYPQKVKSLDLEKLPLVEGVLTGIKGQYLIFDEKHVLNIRKHGGYVVSLEI